MKRHPARKYLYILYSVDAWECTEEEIETKYQILRLKYPNRTREEFRSGWLGYEAEVTIRKTIVGHFTDEADAFCRVLLDAELYANGGANRFCAIKKVRLNYGYPLTDGIWMFRYDEEMKRGVRIDYDESRITKIIEHEIDGWD